MSDFSNKDAFLDFFGSFWNRFFPDQQVLGGVAAGDAHTIAQTYQDMVEQINATSLDTITPFHRELVHPIVLKKSAFSQGPDFLTFGNGAVFGQQPEGGKFRSGVTFQYGGLEQRSGLYYIGIPDRIKNVGRCIINGLIDPSVMLVRDADFILVDDTIVFKDDPFANPLIAQRAVAAEDGVGDDVEIVLWATNVDIDRKDLYRQYGFAVSNLQDSSEAYRVALRAIYHTFAGGPTLHMLDSFVAALAGLPLARRGNEKVLSIETFGTNTLVITDAEVYSFDQATLDLRPEIQAGTVLWAGQPLTTATQVFDRTLQPNWWVPLSGLTIGRDWLVADITSALTFTNQVVPVELGITEVSGVGNSGRTGKFYLAGKPSDVEIFWKGVRARSLQEGRFLGDELYRRAGVVDGDGNPDFTQDLNVTPLEILANDLLADGVIPVRIEVSSLPQAQFLLQNLRILRDVVPAYLGLMILIDVSIEESFPLVAAQSVLETELSPTRALILGDVDSLDNDLKALWMAVDVYGNPSAKILEALSVDISPDIIRETFNLPTDCKETVQAAIQEICTH